jgi:hypothetical protein
MPETNTRRLDALVSKYDLTLEELVRFAGYYGDLIDRSLQQPGTPPQAFTEFLDHLDRALDNRQRRRPDQSPLPTTRR